MSVGTQEKPSVPTFSLAERDRRWKLAREFMENRKLDALIVYGEHEDAGPAPVCFDTWFTNDRAGTTVLMLKDEDPIAFLPLPLYVLDRLEAARRGDDSWISTSNIRIGRHSGELAGTLKKLGLKSGKVGVVGLDPYLPCYPEGIIPYRFWQSIVTAFPDTEFKPVGLEFGRLVLTLSQEEISVLRHAALLGDAMAEAMLGAAHNGISEAEVYAAGIAAAQSRGTVVPVMHFWSGSEFAASGPPQWAYRPKNPRILKEGDLITAEVFCCFGMRHTQHQVSIAIGDVHEDVERAAVVARACYDAGLQTLRANATFGEVAEAMLKPVEAAGGWVRGPQIHSLNPMGAIAHIPANYIHVAGMEQYPDIPPSPTLCADMKLEPGMSFALEPSCGFGRHIVTLGGTVVVGDGGPIELNPRTARLLRTVN